MQTIDRVPGNGWKTFVGLALMAVVTYAQSKWDIDLSEFLTTGQFLAAFGVAHKLDKAGRTGGAS